MIRFLARTALVLTAVATLIATAVAAEPAKPHGQLALATFGGGCFWCTQADFDKVKGVVKTEAGFMGGRTKNPSYDEVAWGHTGHVEVVQVTYDPAVVSYDKLVDYYWRHVDVLDGRGQFSDRGETYRPVIFAHTSEQQQIAEAAKATLEASKRFSKPIAVNIEPAGPFYAAEAAHQKFYESNPFRYKFYRVGSGRDARLKQLWGDEVM